MESIYTAQNAEKGWGRKMIDAWCSLPLENICSFDEIKGAMSKIMDDIIYFELNNWSPDDDYPDAEPYSTWLEDDENIIFLDNEQWVKDNKLCVAFEIIDQSLNFCITATKKWVEENCPTLLTEYIRFLRYPANDGKVYGRFGTTFLSYEEPNIGVAYVNCAKK